GASLEELFRSFHSLKGISAMVELREAEQLAHEMETCLAALREGRAGLTSSMFEALVAGANLLEQIIAARRAGTAVPGIDARVAQLADAHRSLRTRDNVPAAAPVESPVQTIRVTFSPSAELVARGIKVDTVRARLAQLGDIQDVSPRVTTGGAVVFDFLVAGITKDALSDWEGDGITCDAVDALDQPAATPPAPASGSSA